MEFQVGFFLLTTFIINTGVPGIISGIDVDTSFFTGNYAPQVSIQAAVLSKGKTMLSQLISIGMFIIPPLWFIY